LYFSETEHLLIKQFLLKGNKLFGDSKMNDKESKETASHIRYFAHYDMSHILAEKALRKKGKVRYALSFLCPLFEPISTQLDLWLKFNDNPELMSDEEKELYKKVLQEEERSILGNKPFSYDRCERGHKFVRFGRKASLLTWVSTVLLGLGFGMWKGGTYAYKSFTSEESKIERQLSKERFDAYVNNDSPLPCLTLDELMKNEHQFMGRGVQVVGRPLGVEAGGKPYPTEGIFYIILGDGTNTLLGESYTGLLEKFHHSLWRGSDTKTNYRKSLEAKTLVDSILHDTNALQVKLRGVYLGNKKLAVGEIEVRGQRIDLVHYNE